MRSSVQPITHQSYLQNSHPNSFSSHEFCQRLVLDYEVFFFFFIPFTNLIPRPKSIFSVSAFHKHCIVCGYETVTASLCPVLHVELLEMFTWLQ